MASITFSEKVITALKNKVSEHNKKHPSKSFISVKKITEEVLELFYSHRPGMTRGGWAMARVNMFLKMKRGARLKSTAQLIKMSLVQFMKTYQNQQ